MPFTFAHPVIALPFKGKRHLDFLALILGTMAPDFEYFIHFKPYQVYGHTFLGMFFYNLPLTLLLLVLIRYILAASLLSHLPFKMDRLYSYLVRTSRYKKVWVSLGISAYSAVLGMITHILWDGFTHKGGYFVERFPTLNSTYNIVDIQIPLYKILQHGSTLIGLGIIALWIYKIKDPSKHVNIQLGFSKFTYWLAIVVVSITIFIIFILWHEDFAIGTLVVGTISCGFIGVCTISLIDRLLVRLS